MEDLTLQSELYNNLKFNMQKLILDVPENDVRRLAEIFGASDEEVKPLLEGFWSTLKEQSERLRAKRELPPVHEERVLAFIGDSITSDRESYLNILHTLYREEKNLVFVDAAVSGDKSDDARMKLHFRVMNHHPHIVHILIGTNDLRMNRGPGAGPCVSLEEYERNLDYLLSFLQESGVKVLISTLSPVVNSGIQLRFPEDHWYYEASHIKKANEIIRRLAQKYSADLNDMESVYGAYEAEEILLADGLHLNAKGQALLLEGILNILEKYL